MIRILTSVFLLFATVVSSAPSAGQVEVRVFGSGGFTPYYLTWSNGQIITKAGGVPAVITLDKAAVGLGNLTNALQLTAANNLSDLANAGIARTNLGVAIGSNVQAYAAALTTYAGISPSANLQNILGAANYAAVKTLLELNNVENITLTTWDGLLREGLLARFACDEASGTTLANSGNVASDPMGTVNGPAWKHGGIKFMPNNTRAAGAFPATTLSDMAMYVVFKWSAADAAASTYQGMMVATDGTHRIGMEGRNQSQYGRLAVCRDGVPVANGMVDVRGDEWHVACATRSGSTVKLYLDDIEIATGTLAGDVTVDTLRWGLNDSGFTMPATVGYMALYNRSHTHVEVKSQRDAFSAIMAVRGVAMPPLQKVYILAGDSLMANSAPVMEYTEDADGMVGRNLGVPGSVIGDMEAAAGAVDAYLHPGRSKQILVIQTANDLNIGSAATYVAKLKSYCLDRREAGWNHIIICLPTPRTQSGFNGLRATAISSILADPSFYDSLVRLDLDATIGLDGCELNATYFSDGIHLTTAGMQIQVPLILAGVRAAWDAASEYAAAGTLDFDLTSLVVEDKTMTVTGAGLGDVVQVGAPHGSVTSTAQYTGWVSATDTVTIRCRTAAIGENPASGVFRVNVIKR